MANCRTSGIGYWYNVIRENYNYGGKLRIEKDEAGLRNYIFKLEQSDADFLSNLKTFLQPLFS